VRSGYRAGALAILFSIAGVSIADEGSVPLPVAALEQIETIETFAVSPDGAKIAVTTTTLQPGYPPTAVDFGFRFLRTRLYVIDVNGGKVEAIDSSEDSSTSPVWSPDSSQLAYVGGIGDQARLRVWSRLSGATRALSAVVPRTLPRTLSSKPVWLTNGRQIVISAVPEPDPSVPKSAALGVRESIRIFGSGAREEFDTLELYRANIVLVDVRSGRQSLLVTGQRPVTYSVAPNDRWVAYSDLVSSRDGSGYKTLVRIAVVELHDRSFRVVMDQMLQGGDPVETSWSPDSRWLSFVGVSSASEPGCYVADVAAGRVLRVAGPLQSLLQTNMTAAREAPVWTSAQAAYLLTASGDAAGLWRIQRDGTQFRSHPIAIDSNMVATHIDPVHRSTRASTSDPVIVVRTRNRRAATEGIGAISSTRDVVQQLYENQTSLSPHVYADPTNQALVFSEQRADTPAQLWLLTPGNDQRRALTNFNQHLGQYRLGKSRLVAWHGVDGKELHGALLLPTEPAADRRYPLIVQLYGGDDSSRDVNTFGLAGDDAFVLPYKNLQLFATRGYAVLSADTEARPGRPMSDIASSLLAGVNAAIDQGVVDPERLGIIGHSYGGYSVLSVLVQSQRFKAAIVSAGFSNLIDSYSNLWPDGTGPRISWVEEGQGRMGGSLWDYRERYVENSPLFFADRITTPVLVLHGTDDNIVRLHEADTIFLSLRRLGKVVEYVQYVGEGHNIAGSEHISDRANRAIEWFDRYLKPEE
jgi:dipeptidyl aminopeptidase/acylaminoacyl peptidase